jgi:hypothetical protein
MWPCKQATDSNIELTLWCKTQHPHTHESKFQIKHYSEPDHLALQASFRLKVQAWSCPQGRANEPLGVKNASKKKWPTAGPCKPLEGSRCREPPSKVVQNSKIQLSTQKNFNTSPALARACGLESKLQTQNSSSHSNARHCILIQTNQNLNSSSAQAWPWGLPSKLQTRILNSYSDTRHSILILTNQNFNSGSAQALPCGLACKLKVQAWSCP